MRAVSRHGARDAATGAAEATLRGHAGAVTAVAGDRGRVVSAGEDGTVRVWAAGAGGAWAAERVLEAYAAGTGVVRPSVFFLTAWTRLTTSTV